jgi:glycosyltransferase involved in cell wall biosynthesis
VACAEAARAGKPWMVEVVGCAFGTMWNHGSLAGKAVAAPMYLSTRRHVGRARFALYVSQEYLQRRYPCPGTWVGCSNVAIDLPAEEVLRRRLARLDRGGEGRPLALGLVGSLDVDYKGHETALRALRLLEGTAPGFTLRLLGGGDPARWRARAGALGVRHRVETCGTLPGGRAVLEWMDGLDLLLAPSKTEGVPRALIEGMSRALPAVASRVGGIPELVADPWLHAPGDHRALARLVARLAGSPAELKAQARRNWAKAGEYAAPVLEARRDRLLASFRAWAEEEGGRTAVRPAPLEPGRGARARGR